MSGIRTIFEWDERKRRSNLRKHGVDFEDCAAVFAGRTASWVDVRFDYGETRFKTMGLFGRRVVVIAHTESEGVVRIISFRKASKNEQAQYFQEIQV
jgi:uncharacterized DUF497 family protein